MSEVKRFGYFWDGVFVGYDDYAELKAQRDALAAENAALKSAISYVCATDNQPDYQYDGMGCGIEDRGIVDRYEAARYGWDEAMERIYSEVMPCAADIETPAIDAYLNSVRAEGVEILTGKLQQLIDEGTFDAKEIGVAAGTIHEGAQIAAELRAGEPS